jgi:large subunit ribosomal protein L4
MELKVFNIQGQAASRLSLDPAIWDGPVNQRILAQAVAMYRTNRRAGLASTKTRGEVSGGGKKPWKQKHTGRARAGSTRSPLWRHGGSVFGPRRRDMSSRLPQTIRRVALLESLKGKLRDEELVVLEPLEAEAPKTKPFGSLAKTFKAERKSVIVLHEPTGALLKSLRNLPAFELRQAANLNAFDVLNAHKVLVTTSAFERLEQRVKDKASEGGII